ncbi:hypothetical protein [Vibrio sp. M60_M70]|uniref:hypothetical protein n=1 Tax=Vibrio sp. M60_M70 TaxID=3035166 RepID=UPI00301BA162
MNIERIVYDKVKNNRIVKDVLLIIYQSVFYFFSFFERKIILDPKWKMKIVEGHFGFHDRPSVNSSGLVISHRNILGLKNGIAERADIYITDLSTSKSWFVNTTRCYNNQQGSLVTWFDEESIIYNDIIDGDNKTVICDLKGRILRTIPGHFFSISKDRRFISMLCFETFGNGLQGYGYCFSKYKKNNDKLDKTLKVYDILKDKTVLKIPIDFFYNSPDLAPYGILDDGFVYFSHTNFNPSSNKMYFLFRSSNLLRNTSQLYVVDLKSSSIKRLPTGGMVSHLDWIGDEKILAFSNLKSCDKYKYSIFSTKNDGVLTVKSPLLNKDGHPTVISENKFYTDTYPDKKRFQTLFEVVENGHKFDVKQILKLRSPMRFRGVNRVDLHPRVSLNNAYISLDSSFSGKREQIILYK